MFYKIVFFSLVAASLFSIEEVYLKTPHISNENVIGTNVGIRPFRKTGVRIEAEYIGGKLIIHNYGYGGSGLTLSFGGSQEVLDILHDHHMPSKSVAILGAGVAGLITAYDLLKRGYEVHLYADQWPPHLTSHVAAGIWTPLSFPKDLSEEKKQFHLRLEETSRSRFLKSVGENPEFAGIGIINSYSFKLETSPESERTKQREAIIAHFDNERTKNGRMIREIAIDGQLFMDDLYNKVKNGGAVLNPFHFETLEDILRLAEPIIINCTSMGSIQLFQDQEFIPIRGQLVYFNPHREFDYLFFHQIDNNPNDSNLYFVSIYPCNDKLILGGVYELHQSEAVNTQEVIDKMIKNAQSCINN